MYCRNCAHEMDDKATVCVNCGVAKGVGKIYCQNCGNPTDPNAAVCVKCGVALQQGGKSKIAAGLLGIFLGGLGIHNFYLGYTKKAVVQLLLCLVGGVLTFGVLSYIVGIWGLIEGILILVGKIAVDGKGNPLAS